ncbi:hypothetical protein BCV69DRAFT_315255 [Microstroma glucosiphilum]|uniref:Zn(2)-C6 fungal-type domain-containing protein n=1 Tax=Pseudomicrostroma glucosiphilum TaxID=1684307 RepID=A0A316U051_9BASI|nr:hypothetical protein BCV69DRAFT_315255 [Pseudomicrostroma glucosiphilum]PWN17873.1 hypothetical protein BCV69DRAFT_315255 [Pseudomicrostroma glucosiphilum]
MASSLQKGRTSCDACKARKVKCDYERALRDQLPGDASQVSCSSCRTYGLPCTFTRKPRKQRVGARIEDIRRGSSGSSAQGSAQGSALSPASATSYKSNTPSAPGNANFGDRPPSADLSLDFLNTLSAQQPSPEQSLLIPPRGLLDVPFLTIELLNACLAAYFVWNQPLIPIIRSDEVAKGYEAYITLSQGGLTAERTISAELLLALGALGASSLEEEGEALLFGFWNKHTLQRDLVSQFLQRLRVRSWAERDDEEALEVLTACWLLSFRDVQLLGAVSDDIVTRPPLSREALSTMLFSLQINRAPRLDERAPAGGGRWRSGRGERLLTDEQASARRRVFWGVFFNDGHRAMSLRQPLSVPDDAHDHDLFFPELPRPESLIFFHEGGATSIPPSPTFGQDRLEFDLLFRRCAGPFALLVRNVCQSFVSVRSQSLGVPASAARKALGAYTAWYAGLPPPLVIHNRFPENWQEGRAARPTGLELTKLLRVLFLMMLYHSQLLGACTAAEDFGVRADDGEARGGREVESDSDSVVRGLQDAALESLAQVARISRVAGTLGLLRCDPAICRDMPSSFSLWACSKVTKSLNARASGQPDLFFTPRRPTPADLLGYAEDVAFGVSTVDSALGSAEMAEALRATISQAWRGLGQQVEVPM